jgi:hypothetical protein
MGRLTENRRHRRRAFWTATVSLLLYILRDFGNLAMERLGLRVVPGGTMFSLETILTGIPSGVYLYFLIVFGSLWRSGVRSHEMSPE